MAKLSHAEARAALITAYTKLFGRAPTLLQVQMAQGVAYFEAGYGKHCYKNKKTGTEVCDSNNWGAVHAGNVPCDPATSFESTDHHYVDGKRVPYQVCFKKFTTPAEGAEDYLRVLYIGGKKGTKWDRRPLRAIANEGDVTKFAQFMRNTTYYVAPVSQYAAGINTALKSITAKLGEPMPKPTLTTEARQKSDLKRKLLWLGVGAVVIHFARRYRNG